MNYLDESCSNDKCPMKHSCLRYWKIAYNKYEYKYGNCDMFIRNYPNQHDYDDDE